MKEIRVEKFVLSMGVTTESDLEDAKKILKNITGVEPKVTHSKGRNLFGGKPGDIMGCMLTIRNNNDLLKRLLEAKENQLEASNFDNTGNFSFGIDEYINIPDMDYDPQIGIMGLNVAVNLERKGYSVKRRKIPKKIGKKHRIKKEEAIEFVKDTFGTEVKGDNNA